MRSMRWMPWVTAGLWAGMLASAGACGAGDGADAMPGARLIVVPDHVEGLYGTQVALRTELPGASGSPRDPAAPPPVWSSDQPEVARVDDHGRVTLLARGTTTIHVRSPRGAVDVPIRVEGFALLARTRSPWACAVPDSRRDLYCWGKNLFSMPLDDAEMPAKVPVPTRLARGELPPDVRIEQVVLGPLGACALTADGRIFCWGNARVGTPLGRKVAAGQGNRMLPPQEIARDEIPETVHFTALAVGARSACAAGSDHQLYCWGAGELLPQVANHHLRGAFPVPVAVNRGDIPEAAAIEDIAISSTGGCVLADGDVYCWQGGFGAPRRVEAGEHPAADRFVQVESEDLSCALTRAGRVYCRGSGPASRFGAGSKGLQQSDEWRAVPAGPMGMLTAYSEGSSGSTSCGLDRQGAIWCWGHAQAGSAADGVFDEHELSRPHAGLHGELAAGSRLVNLSCGAQRCIGLADTGVLYAWGSNDGQALGTPPERALPGAAQPVLLGLPQAAP